MVAGAPEHASVQPVGPVYLANLFPALHQQLITLLRGLDRSAWAKPTACALWSVKDIAAHLLDTALRRLSFGRDGFVPASGVTIQSYSDLVALLNRLNDDWVRACQRLSPEVIIELMDTSAPKVHELFSSLDPHATAMFGVAWAGQESSPVWFDIGREYTERWLHQQQIREAVAAPGLNGREWLNPVLDVFMRALPHAYREVTAHPGESIRIAITGEAGGDWTLRREPRGWALFLGRSDPNAAQVTLDQETAWKLFSKGLDSDAARGRVKLQGDPHLTEPFLRTLAVMA
jgi:uncharacterized protein (TIGR03083 family)